MKHKASAAKASGKEAGVATVKRGRKSAAFEGSLLLASFKNARKGLRLGMSVKRAIAEGRGY